MNQKPFRADMPEDERTVLKRLVNDPRIPIGWRCYFAEKLGWVTEFLDSYRVRVTTHNEVSFKIYEGLWN